MAGRSTATNADAEKPLLDQSTQAKSRSQQKRLSMRVVKPRRSRPVPRRLGRLKTARNFTGSQGGGSRTSQSTRPGM
ncbi:MAG: hypothetical protein HC866_23895 [Leptolyngbyaceae cyanobacterium RU_5_1]|nr:hypothetical protein [Leptolyngbyaceae cyanobacterium RU_5_1]